MKQVLVRMPLRILAVISCLILSMSAFAQQISVKGHVVDATGEGIIGAAVRVVGQSGGTITDLNGNFTIQANQGDNIQISYVGYKEVVVAAAPSVSVKWLLTLRILTRLSSSVMVR